MNQTVYYRSGLVLLILLLSAPLEAKLLRPTKNGEEKEILIVNSKRRVYYPVKEEGLTYLLSGPARVEFISRDPVIRKKKRSHDFHYFIVLDQTDTIEVNHRYKVQRSIRSVQHPKHSYTYSGNYFINLSKGEHTLQLLEGDGLKYPVLVRVITKEFESLPGRNRTVLTPMVHKNDVKLRSGDKDMRYFECSSEIPLQIEARGAKSLRILSRLEFTQSMGQESSYRLRVREEKKVIGTYYFNTERSSASQILDRPEKVPGKWRSCHISVPEGNPTYSVEVSDRDKVVLTRFILY